MNEELSTRIKKGKLLLNPNVKFENNRFDPKRLKLGLSHAVQKNPTITLEHKVESQNSNLMISHENINVEFTISSDEINPVCSNNLCNLGKLEDERKNIIIDKNKFEGSNVNCKSELLSLDNSLFENINLSFKEKEFSLPRTVNDLNSETYKREPEQSPDIFNSNQEENEEHIADEHAWDMSIRVSGDKSICENQNGCYVSQGLSQIVLNTWVSTQKKTSPIANKSNNLSRLLTNTLKNNAFKKLSNVSSSLLSPSSPDNGSKKSFFGLPIHVKNLIENFKGINSLHDWQEECLNLSAIERRKNLVFALPTSGGKTLVAEILLLKEVLCREKNVLFVLPYVSIAQEKVRALSPFAVELGFLVEEYAGSKGSYPPQKRRRKHSVYIATIEKALGLVHSLIECQRIQELGLVIVDELHLIGEPKRGANLESMLIKLIYVKGDIQIIGMSATIGNLSDIAKFLIADMYTHDFRPVELTEYVKVEEELFKVDHSIKNDVPLIFHSKMCFKYSQEQKQQDPDQIAALVQEVIPNHSCLVFCPSKKNCENVALLICSILDRKITEHNLEEKKALFQALRAEGSGTVCSILRKTLPFGVAYHHSGLTSAERSLLEEAFLARTICCICCTSTLAAGVNLPARRVILRSPYIGPQMINLSKYKQMIGRAGRMGMGEVGEAFLVCKPHDAQKVGDLLSSSMDVCSSQLQGSGLLALIISAVDLGLTPTLDSLLGLCQCSLLAIQHQTLGLDVEKEVKTSLQTLVQAGALQMDGDNLVLSKIGKAAVKANMDIAVAKRLYEDLRSAQDSLVLLSHLHLLYLVTPYTMMDQIRFQDQTFCTAYMDLGFEEIKTASVLGIGEQCIAQLRTGRAVKSSLMQVLHRFYLSLILFDLWNHNSLWKVSNKYGLPRGLVHNFLISTSAFASSVVRFCEVLDDMWCFKLLLADMSSRLTHCCTTELIPLMELPAVKIGRAKQLYNAGFKTLSILATTDPKALVQAVDHMPRRVAHQIVAAAKLMLLAKAESLQEEAEDVLNDLQRVSI